jgi:hypothetical protein
MIADIATGNTGTADVLFLIAAIAFVLAALGSLSTNPVTRFVTALTNIGLALVAVGFLIL